MAPAVAIVERIRWHWVYRVRRWGREPTVLRYLSVTRNGFEGYPVIARRQKDAQIVEAVPAGAGASSDIKRAGAGEDGSRQIVDKIFVADGDRDLPSRAWGDRRRQPPIDLGKGLGIGEVDSASGSLLIRLEDESKWVRCRGTRPGVPDGVCICPRRGDQGEKPRCCEVFSAGHVILLLFGSRVLNRNPWCPFRIDAYQFQNFFTLPFAYSTPLCD